MIIDWLLKTESSIKIAIDKEEKAYYGPVLTPDIFADRKLFKKYMKDTSVENLNKHCDKLLELERDLVALRNIIFLENFRQGRR